MSLIAYLKKEITPGVVKGTLASFASGVLVGTVGIGFLPNYDEIMHEMTKVGYVLPVVASAIYTKTASKELGDNPINYYSNVLAAELGYFLGCGLKLFGEKG